MFEVAFTMQAAPSPWHRTRVLTLRNRYTVANFGTCSVLRVKQLGDDDSVATILFQARRSQCTGVVSI